jgi:hypothetical protein
MNVHNLRSPSAKRPSYLEQLRNRRDRPYAARDHHYRDSFPTKTLEQLVSLGGHAPELERMRAAQDCDIVTSSSQRARLLRCVLQQEIADDQDAHLQLVQNPPDAE